MREYLAEREPPVRGACNYLEKALKAPPRPGRELADKWSSSGDSGAAAQRLNKEAN
jgi:hypothetical protein